jgi:2-phosphosulfolactate phosphatase
MRVHVEWGAKALEQASATAIIVDCLSFSTALSVACARGAKVFPFGTYEGGKRLAACLSIECVGKRKEQGLSLSPPTLEMVQLGQEIVLPSPNGSNLSTLSKAKSSFAGALRNAKAVAEVAMGQGDDIVIVAAGERWHGDGSLRPAFEDQLAAGAIASFLTGDKTSEAIAAMAVFNACENDLLAALYQCDSGKELTERGFAQDVEWASQLNATKYVPRLQTLQKTYEDIGMKAADMPRDMSPNEKIRFYSSSQL